MQSAGPPANGWARSLRLETALQDQHRRTLHSESSGVTNSNVMGFERYYGYYPGLAFLRKIRAYDIYTYISNVGCRWLVALQEERRSAFASAITQLPRLLLIGKHTIRFIHSKRSVVGVAVTITSYIFCLTNSRLQQQLRLIKKKSVLR